MPAAKQREFIKNYREILNLLRIVFYKGCYSQEELDKQMKMGKSKYHQLLKNLDFAMGDFLETVSSSGKKAVRFRMDPFLLTHNVLLDLFSMKSFTRNDLFIALLILQALQSENEALTFAELSQKMEGDFDTRTIERKLNELAVSGYIRQTKKDGKRAYSRAKDIFSVLDNEQLSDLAAFADLSSNILPPSVCGYYLLEDIRERAESGHGIAYETPFLFKHLHLGQVIDDHILWDILGYIHDKKQITFKNNGKTVSNILPYRIIVDEAYGRRYLFGINLYRGLNTPCIYRLDKIQDVTEEKEPAGSVSDEKAEELYRTEFEYSFTVSRRSADSPERVKLVFYSSLSSMIKAYFPGTEAEEINEDHSSAEIYVNSAKELKPWLRRYTGKVWIEACDSGTKEEMDRELEEWRDLYGIGK